MSAIVLWLQSNWVSVLLSIVAIDQVLIGVFPKVPFFGSLKDILLALVGKSPAAQAVTWFLTLILNWIAGKVAAFLLALQSKQIKRGQIDKDAAKSVEPLNQAESAADIDKAADDALNGLQFYFTWSLCNSATSH